jgi:ABC-type enterochelin transport system substrate-binding protein
MKTTVRNLSNLAILSAMLITATTTFAQTPGDSTASTTTTTTSAGTISQFGPDAIVIQTTPTADPVSYSYTKTTTYVDENGNPVSIETVKSGLPVTVYYDRDGDKMVATKVIVRSATVVDPTAPMTQTPTASVTSSGGTVTQYGPDGIVIRSSPLSDPVTYSSTKTTTYVDEDGNTVSSETIKTGAPVTVYYDSVDGKMVATKVIVKRSTTTTTTTPTP